MSVMKTTGSFGYNAICDVCGFKFKASMLSKRWDGLMVCRHDYEMRHPLDFYTTRNDAHLLPWTRTDNNGIDISPLSNSVNWASESNGGVATASSNYPGYLPVKAINGNLLGTGGNYWNNSTSNSFPEWLQVTFSQVRPVNTVIVYCVQDNFTSPSTPYEGMTGTKYTLTRYDIQAYLNDDWKTVASVINDNKIVIRTGFGQVFTDRIRIMIYESKDSLYSRVVELEAYGIYGGVETTAVAGRAISGIAISGRE